MNIRHELEALLGRAIYDGIRSKCRGWIKVDIWHDECNITIRYDDIEYKYLVMDVSAKILRGDFTSEKVVKNFIEGWRRYYFYIQEKKLFYTEEAPV